MQYAPKKKIVGKKKVNPHIAEADEITPGEDVCVLPCSDRQAPSHFRNDAYMPRV